MNNENLKLELKQHMIQYLNLIDMKPEDINDEAPLFGEGLGLDSIDSIELVVLLDRCYGIKLKDPKEARGILTNVDTMVQYIAANRTK